MLAAVVAVEAQPLAHPAVYTMCCYVDFPPHAENQISGFQEGAPLAPVGVLVKGVGVGQQGQTGIWLT